MDPDSEQTLAWLIRSQRIGALGTLRDGAPLVSMVLYVVSPDLSTFHIHVSRLAQHTQDIHQDARVSLMIAETDTGEQDPQTLPRVSIRGEAMEILPMAAAYHEARSAYLEKFPQAALNFNLGDFSLYHIQVRKARYVAGFGKIFNLTIEDFKRAAFVGE